MRPLSSEYAPYFDRYISLVPGERVIPILSEQNQTFRARFGGISEEQGGFRYAPGKWNLREVLGHIIDSERVFAHRAFWIARDGAKPLAGFEQDDFAAAAHHDQVPMVELVDEFCSMRDGHILMLKHLPKEAWTKVGISGENPLSVRAAAFLMAGHFIYHSALLRERYGV